MEASARQWPDLGFFIVQLFLNVASSMAPRIPPGAVLAASGRSNVNRMAWSIRSRITFH